MISKTILDTLDRINIRVNGERVIDMPDYIDYKYDVPYGEHRLKDYDLFINTDKDSGLIVNIHGGGFLSGDKKGVRQFCLELAKMGYSVLSPNYPLPREFLHPEPLKSVFAAYKHAAENYPSLNLKNIFFTGDSAGAYFAAYAAALITNERLRGYFDGEVPIPETVYRGALLYCGLYDIEKLYDSRPRFLMRDMVREYFGMTNKEFRKNKNESMSPIHFMENTKNILLIHAKYDPLTRQAARLSEKLKTANVKVTEFRAENRKDFHDFQLNLNSDSTKICLNMTADFLNNIEKE